jgi:uncharacterized coiled-coil protein SlyX
MDYQIVGAVLAALFFITGGLATIYKWVNTIRKEREEENAKVLKTAKEYIDSKIEKLEADLIHQKDLHEGKISELSDKIEHLREETRRYHSQLVDLITKMLDKNN